MEAFASTCTLTICKIPVPPATRAQHRYHGPGTGNAGAAAGEPGRRRLQFPGSCEGLELILTLTLRLQQSPAL